jgi:hypothetical protein
MMKVPNNMIQGMKLSGLIRIMGCVFIVFLSLTGTSQQKPLDFKTVENESLILYNENQWASLITFGQKALESGHDYYYLRLRLGIAYFNQTNYLQAIHHFEKALAMNQSDPVLLEYIFLAYELSNRHIEALAVSRLFPQALSQKLAIEKLPVIDRFGLNGGYIYSNNIEKNERRNLLAKNDSSYAVQDLNDDKYFLQVDLGINLTRTLNLILAYSYLNTSKLKQIRVPEQIITGKYTQVIGAGVYQGNIYGKQISHYSEPYHLKQHSYYAALLLAGGKGITITPSVQVLHINYRTLSTSMTEEAYLAQPWHQEQTYRQVFTISENDTSFINYVASLHLSKSFSLYNLGFTGSYSNLNGYTQYQGGLSFGWFPFGNLNFYGITKITGAYQQEEKKLRVLFNQLIGFKINDRLWVEAFAAFGEMTNFNEANGYIVYNSGDIIKFRAGANFIVPLSKHTELSFRYHFLNNQSWLIRGYVPENTTLIPIQYENQSFIGGITWKF